jgi:hypothetical protein
MEQGLKEKVLLSIENLKNKKNRLYFMVQDTKGNAKASVRYIYELAMTLKKHEYNPIILHEKNDYSGVSSWLSSDYMTMLPHKSLEQQNLEVSPEDFIILPEIFGYVMDQIKNLPCGKIVITQSYAYMLETLQPGQTWNQFGFLKCITTSNKQKEYIDSVMRNISTDVLKPTIGQEFVEKTLPPMPIIAVHTREQSDAVNLIKTFYLKFPQYRWFTFRDMRGLSEKEFAKTLKECFLSVWIDDESGFGTFPLESMACGVPVIGKVPNLQPEWMKEENGLWIDDKNLLPDFIADFSQNWLEDNIVPTLYDEIGKTSDEYKNYGQFEKDAISHFEGYIKTRLESFEQQISKIEE